MFAILFNVIAPVLLIAVIGYVWVRAGKPFDTPVITVLVTVIGTPMLIVDTLLKVDITMEALATMAGAAALTHLAFLGIGWAVVRAAGQPTSTFLPSMVFGNTGNMGLPLCLFAFGDEGLALAIGYFSINAILLFTLGSQMTAGKASPGDLVKTPLVWAVVLSVALIALDVDLPPWIANTVRLLGGITIPLMLLALGVSLARLQVTSLRRSLYFGAVRLIMGFAVGWGVAWLLGLDGVARGVVVVESALPVAVFNYLFAARYGNRPEEVAGMVVTSTVLSFLTLPLVLWSVMPG